MSFYLSMYIYIYIYIYVYIYHGIVELRTIVPSVESVYTNALYIKQMSSPTVKATSEQLKENLNCLTIMTPCHFNTRSV